MEEYVTNEVCELRGKIYTGKLEALECEIGTVKDHQTGLREDIREVRDLQKTILYSILGVAFTCILILIGVLVGRGIDFGVFFP